MFDNLKIGKKLLLLSGSILLLLAITVLWAAFGLSRTVQNGATAAGGNKLRSDMLHLEIKHDAWNNKVRSFLSDPENQELKVKLDPQTCALGAWYYGEERRQAEAMLPEISTELAALEEPHRRMHESGKKILEVYKPADPKLPITLSDLETSHVNWLGAVQNALLAGHKQILAEGDPEKCGLGQFLHSEQAKRAAEQSPEMAELLKGIAEPHKKLHALVPRMNEALAAADRRELHYLYEDEMMPLLAEVRYMLRSLKRQAEKDLVGLNKAEEIYQTETLPSLMELKGHLSRIAEISEQSVISDQEMLAVAGNTRNGVITIGAFALLLGGFLAYLISRSLTVPMRKTVAMISDLENGHLDTRLEMKRKDEIGQLAETMDLFADSLQHEVVYSLQKLAGGDLTFEIAPRDERDMIRGSLQKLGDDLNRIMLQIQTASEQIDSGSSQVSESAQALSDGAAQSAASVEQISSSMNEIGSQTGTSAENAEQANQLAASAREAADNGSRRMTEMIQAMAEINNAGQNISKIIKVIDEIAFQTNLLALNAAVEAARAGQHGKGFAVVAEEVRNLAARSAKAASETAELIEGSVAKTSNGTQIAERTAGALEEIVGSIGKVTDLIGEIAAASREQAQGISQVNIGLQQIDQVIQQNTASAEESAATSEQLSSQAEELKHQLGRFTLKEDASLTAVPYQAPAGQEAPRISLEPADHQADDWSEPTRKHQPAQHNGSAVLQWDDRFNTGVSLMDKQHRRLVELINKLFHCMQDGGNKETTNQVVDELVNYTVTHFRAEENVMQKNGFPGLDNHKLVHEDFIRQVGVYAEKIKNGKRLPPADIYKFLKNWLIEHIEKQDRDGYGKYIANH